MKNYTHILGGLFTLAFVFVFSAGYGQLKVVANGDLNVGNTTTAPLATLHISKTGQASGFAVERTDGAFVKAVAGSAGSAFVFDEIGFFALFPGPNVGFNGDGTSASKAFTVTSTGNVGIGTLTPAAGAKLDVLGQIFHNGTLLHSDKKLKTKIKKYNSGLDAVLGIDPVSYQYNGKAGTETGVNHIGLLAQELQKYAPEFVVESSHMIYDYPEGIDGEAVLVREEKHLKIKDNEIKYLLWNAIREQQQYISDQEDRISRLENVIEGIANGENEINIELSSYNLAELNQNTPNPFNGETSIQYVIPSEANSAYFEVFDMRGRMVKKYQLDHVGQGVLNINAEHLAGGTYSYRLVVDGTAVTSYKMILQK
ncbi:MAG: tail fiber domain-containing protein [Saprospiraceae bacterium]